ncbi:MAG: hypothetical protein NZ553_05960 [Caldilinea sp.]|nr:hypothetical protein [Caldilinea sp.]MDW8440004.1 hypothetical protein [Caldilineaceae bacterium]
MNNVPKNYCLFLAHKGMKKGAKIGFYLSLFYNFLFPLIWYYTDPSNQNPALDINYLITALIIFPVYGLFIGCLPATILGALTGCLVGMTFALLSRKLTPLLSSLVGVGVAVIIALFLNWFVVSDPDGLSQWLQNWPYLVFLGFPTIIYLLTSPFAAYSLYREIQKCAL